MSDASAVHRRLIDLYPDVLAGRLDRRSSSSTPMSSRPRRVAGEVGADRRRLPSANRYTLRGTHTASGRSYEIGGLDMVRVGDGRVMEHWAFGDWDLMRHQLGV